MNRYHKPYVLIKRTLRSGKTVYYYRIAGEKSARSTGARLKRDAIDFVEHQVLPFLQEHYSEKKTLREYAESFFTPECPHVRRLREENKAISDDYIHNQRSRMRTYLLTDPIADKGMGEIRRADVLDFRSRLAGGEPGTRTVNMTIGILKVIFREAYYREDVDRDPTLGVGELKYTKSESGTFTEKELKVLFQQIPGPWKNLQGYAAFLIAAVTGMRRGEVLDLTWGQIDFRENVIHVDRARTDNGLPKWNRIRATPIPGKCSEALLNIRGSSSWVLPEQRVFCYADGSPLGFTWWRKRFDAAMDTAGFAGEDRKLTPHSFRHTLNSRLREKGVDAAGIRAAMGWSGEKVQEGYTHWSEWEKQRKIVEELFG